MLARDPNWLYSTTAQCTAALVAIIGGFLVTRVVSVANTRENLERQLREVRSQFDLVRPRYDRAWNLLLEEDVGIFFEDAQEAILERAFEGDITGLTVEDLIEDGADSLGRDLDDYRPALALIVQEVERAKQVIASVPPTSWPKLSRDLRAQGVPISDAVEWIYDDLLGRRYKLRPRAAFDIDFEISPPVLGPMRGLNVGGANGPSLDDQVADLQSELEHIHHRERLYGEELETLSDTSRLLEPLIILAGFAAGGLVWPLMLLAWDPVPTGAWIRASVLIAFVVGLGALLRYFGIEIQRLRAARVAATAAES